MKYVGELHSELVGPYFLLWIAGDSRFWPLLSSNSDDSNKCIKLLRFKKGPIGFTSTLILPHLILSILHSRSTLSFFI